MAPRLSDRQSAPGDFEGLSELDGSRGSVGQSRLLQQTDKDRPVIMEASVMRPMRVAVAMGLHVPVRLAVAAVVRGVRRAMRAARLR
jgi:hypothetical protein